MTEKSGTQQRLIRKFSKSIEEIIMQRYSCRTYRPEPLDEQIKNQLIEFLSTVELGPLGSTARFELIAANENDRKALKSLGTYGFIKGATGFIVGATRQHTYNIEDYGFLLEMIILYATDLGLGTCWLGGTFTKSSFAKKISAEEGELVPAVAAIGFIAEKPRRIESIFRKDDGTDRRLPWERLFFDRGFGTPLSQNDLGKYVNVLKMVRLSPSASNRQPWRIVRDGSAWHFYLQRTPGYRENLFVRLTTVADLQRMDLGIAMSHFELTAEQLGLRGRWEICNPSIEKPDKLIEYTTSWVSY